MIISERYSLRPLLHNFTVPTEKTQDFIVSCFLISMLLQKLSTYIRSYTQIHSLDPIFNHSDGRM
jgi:hypothetical protein